ncbi:uncharacterized protein PV09_08132 [Verruconis gallopava]|uniref:Carboxylic ester hydrolase n=1 Tax=Verruconis gallopava TaxID=253628 RepID=A0A0D2A1P0_9PEZI|nr:uncharacterized protein PV09_08132 [Verruconis gallopava]KIW00240.1 hypothetical protein PV09_08132 [Verruconis gallopava]
MAAISFLLLLLYSVKSCLSLPHQEKRAWTIGQKVKTTSGTVIGHEAPWPANSGLSEYLGIPYAQNPVGDLRFSAPKAYVSNDEIDGSKFSEECFQIVDGVFAIAEKDFPDIPQDLLAFGKALAGDENTAFGEDCLKINVWTKPQSGEKSKAVMVWIYGGAFSVGATSAVWYSPARYAAEHDVVAVSFNYRLSLFGFNMATFTEEKNPGLLDQRLALEWVRDNIAAFGGDPKRITVFGESAGGFSVDHLSYAYVDDPIANAYISQSGTVTGLAANSQDDTVWWQVSKSVGCGDNSTSPSESIACMRALDGSKIMDGIRNAGPGAGVAYGVTTILSFWPVADNKTVFADAWDREEQGRFARRPMLVTNNAAEGNLVLGALNAGLDWATTIPGVFNCPAATAAKARHDAGVPVWRAYFMGQWNNTNLGGLGAYHVSDVPLVMGATERKEGATPDEPEETLMIKNVMNAWAAFAKDPENGLTNLGWPRYDPEGNTLIRLGLDNKGTPSIGQSTMYDYYCKAMRHVGPSEYKNLEPVKQQSQEKVLSDLRGKYNS